MWQKVKGPFQEFGFLAGLLYAVDRVLRGMSDACGLYVYELMAQPISAQPLLPPNLLKNLAFVEIERGHPDIERMSAREDIKASRFDQGARCLGVLRKGQLIGYIWFCFDRYEEDEVRCTYELAVPERSVFDFDLYVFPEHRMGVGFIGIWHGANAFLRERGIEHTFSRLTRFNLASRRSHAHFKWKRIGQALFLKLWQLEFMVSNLAPYVAVTSTGSRVRLRLSAGAQAAEQKTTNAQLESSS